MEYDSQSWKDRCNRYFTSISETEKKDGVEKDLPDNNKDQLHEEYASLRDIGALQRNFHQEHSIFRYMRKTLSGLDIHGARFGSKTRSTVELVMWFIIVLAALAALGCILYIQIRDYSDIKSHHFIYTSLQTDNTDQTPVALSFCNKNLLKKSHISGTKYAHLLSLDTSSAIIDTSMQNAFPQTSNNANDVISSNVELSNFLNRIKVNMTDLYNDINSDIGVTESLRESNVSVDYRLSLLGKTEVLRRRILMTQPWNVLGRHDFKDIVLDCWMDDRICRQSEMSSKIDEQFGQCTTVIPGTAVDSVTLTLNTERAEYVHVTSPTVGFSVFLHQPGTPLSSGTRLSVEPNQLADVIMSKARTIERTDGTCNPVTGGHETCMLACFHGHVRSLCQCSTSLEGTTRQCDPDVQADYVCIQTLEYLRRNNFMRCGCAQNCRETHYQMSAEHTTWPSAQSMIHALRYLSTIGHTFTETAYRENVARISLSVRPEVVEVVSQSEQMSLIQLLANLGGLSALIAGVSLVTVGELCWTLGRSVMDIVKNYRKRSNGEDMPRRLSDSDVTSVTWAMYKQRRREEEENKEQQNNFRRAGQQHVIGGNVQARISKRNIHLPTVSEEQRETGNTATVDTKELNNSAPGYKRYEPGFYESKQYPAATRNGYRRNSDRRPGSTPGDRPQYNADTYQAAGIGMVIPRYHSQEKLSDPRLGRHSPTDATHVYSNGRLYSRPLNAGMLPDRNGSPSPGGEQVQLYGNSSAYFHSHVSEPLYL